MQYINAVGDTTIYFTLYEKTTIDPAYYTFKLVHKDTRQTVVFSALDISLNPTVYNKFVVSMTTSNPVPTLGKIAAKSGEYEYFVYESETPENLNLDTCGKIIEVGLIFIETAEQSTTTYVNYNDTTVVYKG